MLYHGVFLLDNGGWEKRMLRNDRSIVSPESLLFYEDDETIDDFDDLDDFDDDEFEDDFFDGEEFNGNGDYDDFEDFEDEEEEDFTH